MSIIEPLDLRPMTAGSERIITKVQLGSMFKPWMLMGRANLSRKVESLSVSRWVLSAYLKDALTPLHERVFIVSFSLVGLEYIGVSEGKTYVGAFVDPQPGPGGDPRFATFHVPRANYNPRTPPEAEWCPMCKCEMAHWTVPSSCIVPPFHPELYEEVRGKQVTISFSTVED